MSVQVQQHQQAKLKGPNPAKFDASVAGRFDLQKFMENLGVLAGAHGGVPALRRLILELAIRGRLGDFGSRSFHLEATSRPFSLPDDWQWCQGDDLFTFVTSGSRGWARYYSEGGPVFLRIGNLDYESIELDLRHVQHVKPPPNAEGIRTRVEPGDVLISITGDTGMVGLVPAGLGEAYINQHIALARPGANVLPAYVARALTAPSMLGRLQGAQRGIKNSLGLEDVRTLALPVPPLAEQKRIVAKVDQLMALCDDLEVRQAKKREVGTRLTKSALEALTTADGPEEFDAAWKRVVDNFPTIIDRAEKVGSLRGVILDLAVRGRLVPSVAEDVDALLQQIAVDVRSRGKVQQFDPITDPPHGVPSHWRWVRWGQLALATSSGWSPQCENRPRTGKEWGVLKVSAVSWDVFKPEENKALPPGVDPRPEFAPKKGDFLMSRANTADLVGRSVVVEEEPDRVFLSDKIIKCVFSRHVSVKYMNFFNRTQTARRHYMSEASGTSDSMKNISREVILTVPVPLPPLGEQLAIVARVEQLMKMCDDLEAELHRAEGRAAKLVEAVVQELVA